MPASIHFADLTSPRARALLDAGPAPVLLLPVGAVEPHGPHAPLGTDSIISTAICERAAMDLSGDRTVRAFVLPEIAFGVTRYSAAFTGAVTISEGTLHAIVLEVCASLRAQGFRHQVIVNSHFEPAQVATLRRAAVDAKVGLLDITRRAVAEQLTPEFQSGAAHAGTLRDVAGPRDPTRAGRSRDHAAAARVRAEHAGGHGRGPDRLPGDGHGSGVLRGSGRGHRGGGRGDAGDALAPPDRPDSRAGCEPTSTP